MKTLLIITSLLLGQTVFAQYRIDSNVRHEFDSLFNLQPKDIQEKRYDSGDGFALLLNFKEDTLNIKEFTPHAIDSAIKIDEIDPSTGKELQAAPKDTINGNQWLSTKATLLKDKLTIKSGFGFFAGFGFSVRIIGIKTSSDFFEYVMNDKIYRKSLTGPKSSIIQVKARPTSVVLSNIPKKSEDNFYGKATLVTEPFYRDDDQFKHGYIFKKYAITYLFICKVTAYEKK